MRWVYGDRVIRLSKETLGEGAKDRPVIEWCAQNGHVWVSKDWDAASEETIVRELQKQGVSAWWLRAAGLGRRQQLWMAARDLDHLIERVEAAEGLGPIYFESRLNMRARVVTIPVGKGKRAGRRR